MNETTPVRTALALALALGLAACLASGAATAQTIYRCGPDGRVYSQMPCAQGRVIDARDVRSEQQRQEGQAVADTQRALADALEGDRLARESRLAPGAASLSPRVERAKPAPSAPTAEKGKKKKSHRAKSHEADFTAIAPARRKS